MKEDMTFEEFLEMLDKCPVENVDGTDEMEEAYLKAQQEKQCLIDVTTLNSKYVKHALKDGEYAIGKVFSYRFNEETIGTFEIELPIKCPPKCYDIAVIGEPCTMSTIIYYCYFVDNVDKWTDLLPDRCFEKRVIETFKMQGVKIIEYHCYLLKTELEAIEDWFLNRITL